MNARELMTWLEENKVTHPLAFGAEICKLMRWVGMQKMVIQSPRSTTRYVIKSKRPVMSDPFDPRREVAQFRVTVKTVEPLIPSRSKDWQPANRPGSDGLTNTERRTIK